MTAVAILLPWLALLLRGKVGQGLLCLLLQITIIGWLPAAVWAVVVVCNDDAERRYQEMIDAVRGRQS